MTSFNRRTMNGLSIVSTLVDAALALRRGQRKTALLLVAAAALSRRAPGLGTAVSVVLRVARRFR